MSRTCSVELLRAQVACHATGEERTWGLHFIQPRADPAVRTSRHHCFPPHMTLDADTEQAGSCVPRTKATPAPSAQGRLPRELLARPREALLVTAQAGTQGSWGRGRGVAGELQL